MLKLNQYTESWELARKWVKQLDRHLPRGIITFYGGFYRGEIKKSEGEWKEVILICDENGYDLEKQYRKGRDHFLEQASTKRFDPLYTARSCFLTPEMAQEFYDSHSRISVKEFGSLVSLGVAKYFRGRRFTLLYKGGLEYDTL